MYSVYIKYTRKKKTSRMQLKFKRHLGEVPPHQTNIYIHPIYSHHKKEKPAGAPTSGCKHTKIERLP